MNWFFQDPLEAEFAKLRYRPGQTNHNPTPLDFMRRIRLQMLRTGKHVIILSWKKTTRIMVSKGMVSKSKYSISEKNKGMPVSICPYF